MKRSTDRILTTHTGALPRPADLRTMVLAKEKGEPYDHEALAVRTRTAVAEAVHRQLEAGLDIIDDGEQSKGSFTSYVGQRIGGFENRPGALSLNRLVPWHHGAGFDRPRNTRPPRPDLKDAPGYMYGDWAEFPEAAKTRGIQGAAEGRICVGPVTVRDATAVRTDIENLKAALRAQNPVAVFMPSASPGQIVRGAKNEHYPNDEKFIFAVADAMRDEYEAIANAGFVLSLDAPDLASGANSHYAGLSIEDFRKVAAIHVEALNYAVKNIPPEQMEIHVCWGSAGGDHPKHRDIELKDILDIILNAKVQGFSIEAANPRHEHEYHLFENVRLPAEGIIIPGVLTNKSVTIEHPDMVAERLTRYAKLVGRENVIASADCGFGGGNIHPTIAWAKFEAMAEGARRASKQLWRR